MRARQPPVPTLSRCLRICHTRLHRRPCRSQPLRRWAKKSTARTNSQGVPFGHFTKLNWICTRLDGWLRRRAMLLEPTPIGIEISQTVPDKKVEEGSRLKNGELNQKTSRSPPSIVNLKESGVAILSMQIRSLTCKIMSRENAQASEMWRTRSCRAL
jgi:hypothetical protein